MRINISTGSPVYPIIIILAASFAVYFNSLFNGFVYDDIFQVVKNPWITDVKYIADIFLKKTWGFTGIGSSNYYRPMMHLVYMLDYYIFGPEPWGFHLVNIFLHACVSALVFLIAERLASGAKKGGNNRSEVSGMPQGVTPRIFSLLTFDEPRSFAFIAALLFALHPIHTEAVAWVAGLPELSFTFFYLLSFYLFILSESGAKAAGRLSVLFFFLSVLCKETALTLPILFFAYDHAFRQTGKRRPYVRKYFPYVAAAGFYFFLRIIALGGLAPQSVHKTMSGYQYVINIFPLFGEYLVKLLFPINLSALYVFRPISTLFSVTGMLSLTVTIAFCVLTIRAVKGNGIVFLCLLFIVVPLLPTFYIPAIAQPFAERYLYLPSFGFAMILSMALIKAKAVWTNKTFSMTATVLVLALIAGYSAATVRRNVVWKTSYSLWADTARKSPDSFIAHLGLGNALLEDKGRVDDAIAQYRTALQLSPGNPDIYDNLGFALFKKGLVEKAMEQYHIALTLKPGHADARANLGLALASLGRTEEAMEQYRIAIASDPTFADAHNYLGAAYKRIGETAWAIREFEEAVRLDPSNAAFRKDLSDARETTGDGEVPGK